MGTIIIISFSDCLFCQVTTVSELYRRLFTLFNCCCSRFNNGGSLQTFRKCIGHAFVDFCNIRLPITHILVYGIVLLYAKLPTNLLQRCTPLAHPNSHYCLSMYIDLGENMGRAVERRGVEWANCSRASRSRDFIIPYASRSRGRSKVRLAVISRS